jgi:hypothetical protein
LETIPVNNPYPTTAELRAESIAGRLLVEQAAATERFHVIIRHAIAGISDLRFPLGSPAPGYDLDDITGAMFDWLAPRDAQQLEDQADDAALDLLECV